MEKTDFRPRDRWLTYAFLVGPLAALTQLTVMYTLVPEACEQQSKMMLHASSLAFFILALTGAWIGWRDRQAGNERTRWLAVAVILLSLGSALVIVALEIPNLILRSCD
jgi:cytochrome bd-type quinol oxidase subunit 2